MNFSLPKEARFMLESTPKRKKPRHLARLDNDATPEKEEPDPFTLEKPTGEGVIVIRKTEQATPEEKKENGDE